MKQFFLFLYADFQKTKRLPIRKAHLFIPIGIAGIFLAYYSFSGWDTVTKISAYFQILGIGLPFLIGLFCATVAEQEAEAGGFFGLLSLPDKTAAFGSKLLLLFLSGGFSLFLATLLFGGGYAFLYGSDGLPCTIYLFAPLLLWSSSMFLYLVHFLLAVRFSGGLSAGLGIMESLLSALMLTGLGDRLWLFLPPSWGARLVSHLLLYKTASRPQTSVFPAALPVCCMITLAALAEYFIFIRHFEGRKGKE